ncbi:BadF/BadG/BcrA/BcrD ATPase family protein [Halocatena marina]|uniref:BadF/BadG/BcrA/BcrD ATPase family protein n=1 Tax=Halocatena marina TaxID=2934937 RepID=A0ABD5YRK3_9EURY|nr:BadF/BadG/BcrA/BcrD ATPase family protein [Halocatena marina]
MTNDVVVGIDGGGTRTRVIVADVGGRVLGTAERGGASTEFNDPEKARQNLREGVKTALADAERAPGDVAELTAGIGGLATPQSYTEAEQFLAIDALACETRVVNDAVVAHIGALRDDAGIVAIGGTGSLVFGITADGDQVSNYDCLHYARAGAHNLGERALHALLSGEAPTDWRLGNRLLERWDCESVVTLQSAVRKGDRFTNTLSGNPLDRVAPLITGAAADGDPFARAICDDAIAEVVTGIRLVGGFLETPVAVAPAGSVLLSEYMTAELRRQVTDTEGYRAVKPAMSPVAGAAFDAIDRATGVDDAVVERLTEHAMGHA